MKNTSKFSFGPACRQAGFGFRYSNLLKQSLTKNFLLKLFILLFIHSVLFSSSYAMGIYPSPSKDKSLLSGCNFQTVSKVVDGDTFDTHDGNRVRLIGIDTPEIADPRKPVQWFAREASKKLKEWIDKETVCLKGDIDKTQNIDKYGRLLRYAWKYPSKKHASDKNAFFINAELIQQGYAFAYIRFPFQYPEDFKEYERNARKMNLGLWDDKKQKIWEEEYKKNKALAETCRHDKTACPEDALKHIGKLMTIRFFVEKSHDSGKAVFLNSNINYKDADNFTAVIFDKNRKNFQPYPADFYWGRTVEVTGRIKKYKGRAEIILKDVSQIKVIDSFKN